MPFNAPNPPSGGSAAAAWFRRIAESIRANKILPGRGYRVKHTTQGTILEVEPGNGGGVTTYYSLKMCKITSIGHGDYIGVKLWDGAAVSGDEFNVAKDYPFRTSLTGDHTDGVDLTYVYSGDNSRTSSDGTTTETEVCYPRYVVGSTSTDTDWHKRSGVVWIKDCDHSGVLVGGIELTKIEDKPARVWARQYAT
jgi:hypothetical protein